MKKTTQLALLVSFGFFAIGGPMQARVSHLLPKPQSITVNSEATPFSLVQPIKIDAAKASDATRLAEFIKQQGGTVSSGASAVIKVAYVTSIPGATLVPQEAYMLHITGSEVTITVVDTMGVLRAIQTLSQLALGWDDKPQVEALSITDYPHYKIRGYMHDIGRSYMEVAELKKEIDLLSRFKINVFHWHLTENQGWRIESKIYPQLNAPSSYTRALGKYYTQAEIKDLTLYAEQHGITILPEIDMPGHSDAFEKAMGHVMQSAQGVKEVKALLREAVALFPNTTYFNLGGDETAINTYRENGKNFMQIMIPFAKDSLGKKVMVWNPGASGFDVPNSGADVVACWGRMLNALSGFENIDYRFHYMNHMDTYADLVNLYRSGFVKDTEQASDIVGPIAALWTDHKLASDSDIIKQNNFYAVMLALAERAWLGGKGDPRKNGAPFSDAENSDYKEFVNWENRFLYYKDTWLAKEPIPYVKQSNVRWQITDAFPNGGNVAAVLPPDTAGIKESYTYKGKVYSTRPAIGGAVYLRHTRGDEMPGFYPTASDNSTAYAYTYVYSPIDQVVGAQISFQDYSRSNNDKVPDRGAWDRRGSRLWVNDKEIAPPAWTYAGQAPGLETNMGNENFTARRPTEIALQKGWNKVFMKLPYLSANSNGVSLVKWMFTFILTDKAGTKAVDGLIYSPHKLMDSVAEDLLSVVANAKSTRARYVSDEVGYYPVSAAADLDKVIAEVEPTLADANVTSETRIAQINSLQNALASFTQSLAGLTINQPKASHSGMFYYYRFSTPNRGNRFPVSAGRNAALVGQQNPTTQASQWFFSKRADVGYDIINRADSTYISPASGNNTALKTVATKPSAGWMVKKAATTGYVIIVSGSVQFNQTNINNSVYNWGGGTELSDDGCQYSFSSADSVKSLQASISPALLQNTIKLVGGSIHVNGSANNVEVCSPDGRSVPNCNLYKGVYLVSFDHKTVKYILP